MTPVYKLFRLQQADTAIEKLEKDLASLPPEEEILRELAETESAVEKTSAQLSALQRELKRKELEDQTFTRKMQELEEKLYSGRVTNPKELSGFQQDLEQFRRRRDQLEEKMLEMMEEADGLKAEVARAREQLRELRTRTEDHVGALRARRAALEEELRRARLRRDQAAAEVEAKELERYEELRRRKGGLAVADAEGGRCLACGTRMPDARFRKVLAGQTLETCSTCRRILYAATHSARGG